MATITYISATTIAGAVGGGGLGSVALNYGYHRFDNSVLYTSIIYFYNGSNYSSIGNWIYKRNYKNTGG